MQFTSLLVNYTTMTAAPDKFWNGVAEKYARRPVANVPAFEAKKAAIKARLQPGDTILEVGCGTGSVAIELAAHTKHVHALDLSEEMIRIARRKATAAGVTNVTFHVGTVDDLSRFEPDTFDMVCAMNLLHLVEDRARVLAQCFELLRPGGCLVESTVVLGESWVPYRLVLGVMKLVGRAPPVWILDADELYRDIEAAGFRNVEKPSIPAGKVVAFSLANKPAPRVAAQAHPTP